MCPTVLSWFSLCSVCDACLYGAVWREALVSTLTVPTPLDPSLFLLHHECSDSQQRTTYTLSSIVTRDVIVCPSVCVLPISPPPRSIRQRHIMGSSHALFVAILGTLGTYVDAQCACNMTDAGVVAGTFNVAYKVGGDALLTLSMVACVRYVLLRALVRLCLVRLSVWVTSCSLRLVLCQQKTVVNALSHSSLTLIVLHNNHTDTHSHIPCCPRSKPLSVAVPTACALKSTSPTQPTTTALA